MAKRQLTMKNKTPMIPIARAGRLKTPEKKRRRITLNKFIEAIEILNPLVFLSMYGLMILMAMRNVASIMTKATA